MNEIAPRSRRDVVAFDPKRTRAKMAKLDGEIVTARKLKDWPSLEAAVDDKIEEQVAFVAEWDEKVGDNHGGDRSKCAPGRTWTLARAEAEWGISHQTVSRWRITFDDPELKDAYRRRLIGGPMRVAFAQVGDRDHRLSEMIFPIGRYPVLLVDPPWRYENPPMGGGNRSIENHYPTMTLDQICALPVADLATDDAILYMWATAPKLAECFDVIEAWGFTYRTNLVWVKNKIGMGYHARSQHELLLVAKVGSLPPPSPKDRVSSVIYADRGRHSEKPDEVYHLIERWYPTLARIELFARKDRDGWVSWGNQLAVEAAQ